MLEDGLQCACNGNKSNQINRNPSGIFPGRLIPELLSAVSEIPDIRCGISNRDKSNDNLPYCTLYRCCFRVIPLNCLFQSLTGLLPEGGCPLLQRGMFDIGIDEIWQSFFKGYGMRNPGRVHKGVRTRTHVFYQ